MKLKKTAVLVAFALAGPLALAFLPGALASSAQELSPSAKQEPLPAPSPTSSAPRPDLQTLIQTVEKHERKSEDLLRTYTWRESVRFEHRDGTGAVKKTTSLENEVFNIDGAELRRQTGKDGKPLSQEEQRKEDERIAKEIERAKDKQEKGQPQARHHEQIPLSRFLELGTFSNERRELQKGRPVVAIDSTGNPEAKTRSEGEKVIHDIAGTIWVDEAERSITRLEGRFIHSFKMGAGVVVNIHEGTSFHMQMARVNEEIWLPHRLEVDGEVRAFLLLDVKGHINVEDSDYRKYKATATLLPDMTPVEPASGSPK